MKKLLLLLLASAMLAGLVACNGAETPDSNVTTTTENAGTNTPNIPDSPASDFEYKIIGDGITITKYTGSDAKVGIPGIIDGKNVTVIGHDAFYMNQSADVIVFPDSIEAIESRAFAGCSVTTVVLSKNLKSIGSLAFAECKSLSSITLPETLITIKTQAFMNCTALKHINIPKSITEWEREVFLKSGLETVKLEDGLEIIGEYAFFDTNLKEVVVPGSVKTIAEGAFGRCKDLESITLKEGIVNVEGAFTESKITEIIIPASVETITDDAFSYCTALEKVKFEGNAPKAYLNEDSFVENKYTNYTIYYHEGAEGFTSPEWNGYPTATW